MSEEEKNGLIHFKCRNCGQKIRVPQIHVGKEAKCPKCKNALVIPKPKCPAQPIKQNDVDDSVKNSIDGNLTLTFPNVPQEKLSFEKPAQKVAEEQNMEYLRAITGTEEPTPVASRKLPWLIDIFLYPTSSAGLTILVIVVVMPLLIKIPCMLIPLGFLIYIPCIIVIGLYTYWYLCACIHDSAKGNLRAPDVIASSPGLGDMLEGTLKMLGCFLLYAGPAGIYFLHTRKIDTVFWSLLVYAVVFFPIGLLAFIMFDSYSAFNPFKLIASVFRTFFQYCGLVFLLYLLVFLFGMLISRLPQIPLLSYAYKFFFLYLIMVMAHLLGRFYFRYQDKLKWDV